MVLRISVTALMAAAALTVGGATAVGATPHGSHARSAPAAAAPAAATPVADTTLSPLAVPGGPWLGSGGEMLAAAYMRDGKPQLAAPVWGMIAKDDRMPPSLRSRASQMAAMLGTDVGPMPTARE